jgi:hypothetical protein
MIDLRVHKLFGLSGRGEVNCKPEANGGYRGRLSDTGMKVNAKVDWTHKDRAFEGRNAFVIDSRRNLVSFVMDEQINAERRFNRA